MEPLRPRGYSAVLHNRHFLALWMAQVFSNTALTGSFFLQLILIEDITKSSAQLAAVILAFSLPAVLLSAMAGLVVDRVSKKYILVISNALRVVTGAVLALLAGFLLSNRLNDAAFLVMVYLLVFLTSAIGQFFAPAEGSTIPLIVSRRDLLAANSLFTLTFTASQILGLVILAPLGVKAIGIVGSLWVAAGMYIAATLLVGRLPLDSPARASDVVAESVSAMHGAWQEIREGWHFAVSRRMLVTALLQLALVSALTMMMAMLAPGYAVRVLGLAAEDATYVFWPAGVGMLLASIAVGRWGNHMRRQVLASAGMFGMGLALAGLAWAGGGSGPFDRPLFVGHPDLVISTAASIMFFSLIAGVAIALINIPAQTLVQEESNDSVRGRVFAIQFTLSNALGIPPLLFVGTLADIYGIPRVTLFAAIVIIVLAIINYLYTGAPRQYGPASSSRTFPD